MDIILGYADDIILDKLWKTALPMKDSIDSTSPNLFVNGSLPHGQPISASFSCPNLSCVQPKPYLPSQLPRDNIVRQIISIYMLVYVGILVMYLLLSSFSYKFLFDHQLLKHPKFLPNQVKLEIKQSLKAIGPIDLLSLPWFLAEVRGHSMLYENLDEIKGINLGPIFRYLVRWLKFGFPNSLNQTLDSWISVNDGKEFRILGGWTYLVISFFLFFAFTDFSVYLVHRWEHHPSVYKHIHKAHHRWIIPTPFASYAFHPVDGYLQSVPYHIFIFIVPFHKTLFMVCFVLITVWTIFIHDSELTVGSKYEDIINGPTHHTLHHLHFNCNYGQYLTWADQFFNTYRAPTDRDRTFLQSKPQKASSPPSSDADLKAE